MRKKKNVKYLRATMGVRYWMDCEYSEDNGKTWVDGSDFDDESPTDEEFKKHIPFITKKNIGYGEDTYWEILIDVDNGKVVNWPKGLCLKTNFKVCDDGEYVFLDKNLNEVINITTAYDQYYVPDFLSLEDEGYGDYVYINIDGDGQIEHVEEFHNKIEKYFGNGED